MTDFPNDYQYDETVIAPPPTAPDSGDLRGVTLGGRYRIVDRLGEGGMGEVYRGEHIAIGKPVAIKVLSQDFCHNAEQVERFLREARSASMIRHENVVDITDFGPAPNGSVYLVMEFLEGEDLGATLEREGPLPWPRVRLIMEQICRALEAAHAKGIVHRDMKPENCFRVERRDGTDRIKVLDFGLAKVIGEDQRAKPLTRTGVIFGTPEYMSPEQARGESIDHRVDVYAVGIILYQLLTGQVPFTAETFMGVLTRHVNDPVRPPSDLLPPGSLPASVDSIVMRALAKSRDERYSSVRELAEAIEGVPDGFGTGTVRSQLTGPQPERARGKPMLLWVSLGLGTAVLGLGIALVYVLATGTQAEQTPPMAAVPLEGKTPDETVARPGNDGGAPSAIPLPAAESAMERPGDGDDSGPTVPDGGGELDVKAEAEREPDRVEAPESEEDTEQDAEQPPAAGSEKEAQQAEDAGAKSHADSGVSAGRSKRSPHRTGKKERPSRGEVSRAMSAIRTTGCRQHAPSGKRVDVVVRLRAEGKTGNIVSAEARGGDKALRECVERRAKSANVGSFAQRSHTFKHKFSISGF